LVVEPVEALIPPDGEEPALAVVVEDGVEATSSGVPGLRRDKALLLRSPHQLRSRGLGRPVVVGHGLSRVSQLELCAVAASVVFETSGAVVVVSHRFLLPRSIWIHHGSGVGRTLGSSRRLAT